jgi:hypothetical protein
MGFKSRLRFWPKSRGLFPSRYSKANCKQRDTRVSFYAITPLLTSVCLLKLSDKYKKNCLINTSLWWKSRLGVGVTSFHLQDTMRTEVKYFKGKSVHASAMNNEE